MLKTVLPQEPFPGAQLVRETPSPDDLERNYLWISRRDGTLVPAGEATPAEFDEAVTEYMTLLDRVNWPAYHRAMILSQMVVPLFRIPYAALPNELRERIGLATIETGSGVEPGTEINIQTTEGTSAGTKADTKTVNIERPSTTGNTQKTVTEQGDEPYTE